ncbi:MAG: hypothetical protein KQJ78_11380 [Deltaproteobacteria bacterium]|nr:hypothetical protein [Deltaproteobacteria bacterium]
MPLYLRPKLAGPDPGEILGRLGVENASPEALARTLPFSGDDATVGLENELQAAVAGPAGQVDLPCTIQGSNYFRNVTERQGRGELPARVLGGLEAWLAHNPSGVWENSWVRLALAGLCPLARRTLEHDLLADKSRPGDGPRGDAGRFFLTHQGQPGLRVPVSYLLKLALVDAVGSRADLPASLVDAGLAMAEHFLNDNTSPETYSFYVTPAATGEGPGRAAASEAAQRFALTQLLLAYAGRRFGLDESGQRVLAYHAPHPPVRQKELNASVTDSFYRELFMSPCLAGWDKGEAKHRYMHLCHQVLSRAQLNGLARLREAGIITRNLVVLPHTSNISLANNGTHVSLGSRRWSEAVADPGSGVTPAHEKNLGDLAIKFVEHFLPLFVGTYSAAPYRLAFQDFPPEQVLSFLPLELDYTHLRMIWRRWRKKADLKALGFRLTPFGPPWLDATLARVLRLRGDFVPDFRLIDYLAAVMSTHQSPALDGSLDSQERLKADLADQGIFDPKMAIYLLYRQRRQAVNGYSGFEGRHYSLFEDLENDLAQAVNLQLLVTALAQQQMARGRLAHAMIPDHPEVESERRQIFFGAAIGLPTFYVREDTPNRLLREILALTEGTRPSRRYRGYVRVRQPQFRLGLLAYLRREAGPLAEALGLGPCLEDLAWRLAYPERRSALGRLTMGAVDQAGGASPLEVPAGEFNAAAESYYQGPLRRRHLTQGLTFLREELARGPGRAALEDPDLRRAWRHLCRRGDPAEFLTAAMPQAAAGTLSEAETLRLLDLLLLNLATNARRFRPRDRAAQGIENNVASGSAPVHRALQR